MKRCSRCGETKQRGEFHTDKTRTDGLCRQCKDCKRAYARTWNARNPERKAESSRRWYDANREIANARAKQWNAAHPECRREIQQRWRERNPEWVLANRRLSMRARRRRGQAVPYALILMGDPCSYCGESMDHIDHIVPVASGGTSDWDNLTAACGPCNIEKRDRSLLAFIGGLA